MSHALLSVNNARMETGLESIHEPRGSPTRVLFLVHGTFAKHAKWVRSGSKFCESLLDHLGPQTSIQSFIWSGRNSVGARQEAACRLRDVLQESVKRFHGADHFVIGHSHGGNVALKAVASPDLANVGVVCLSTPILHLVARRALTESNKFIWLVLILVFGGTLIAWVLAACLGVLSPHSWLGGLWIFVAFFFCFLCGLGLEAYRAGAEQTAKTIEIPDHGGDRVLFLRFIGDEA